MKEFIYLSWTRPGLGIAFSWAKKANQYFCVDDQTLPDPAETKFFKYCPPPLQLYNGVDYSELNFMKTRLSETRFAEKSH